MITKTFNDNHEDEIRELLIGRRIVWNQLGQFHYPGRRSWEDKADAKIVLDDGTVLYVLPNFGCGGCSNGHFYTTGTRLCDNIITNVTLAVSGADGCLNETYCIFVYADNEEINALQVEGSDDSGFYGSGYQLFVVFPDEVDNQL